MDTSILLWCWQTWRLAIPHPKQGACFAVASQAGWVQLKLFRRGHTPNAWAPILAGQHQVVCPPRLAHCADALFANRPIRSTGGRLAGVGREAVAARQAGRCRSGLLLLRLIRRRLLLSGPGQGGLPAWACSRLGCRHSALRGDLLALRTRPRPLWPDGGQQHVCV